jgi:hypothetical protein
MAPQTPDSRHRESAPIVDKARAELRQAEANVVEAQAQLVRSSALYRLALEQALTARTEGFERSMRDITGRFLYRIPVKLGETKFNEVAHIDILEIWGTRPTFETGGQYLVRAKYVMPSRKQGKIYFYETTNAYGGVGPTFDLQTFEAKKGSGEFSLLHGMSGPGEFHLQLLADDGNENRLLANVYFK